MDVFEGLRRWISLRLRVNLRNSYPSLFTGPLGSDGSFLLLTQKSIRGSRASSTCSPPLTLSQGKSFIRSIRTTTYLDAWRWERRRNHYLAAAAQNARDQKEGASTMPGLAPIQKQHNYYAMEFQLHPFINSLDYDVHNTNCSQIFRIASWNGSSSTCRDVFSMHSWRIAIIF